LSDLARYEGTLFPGGRPVFPPAGIGFVFKIASFCRELSLFRPGKSAILKRLLKCGIIWKALAFNPDGPVTVHRVFFARYRPPGT
jgi:hypothetical protein